MKKTLFMTMSLMLLFVTTASGQSSTKRQASALIVESSTSMSQDLAASLQVPSGPIGWAMLR